MNQDTLRLLRECDAGIKMGVATIENVEDHVQAQQLRDYLNDNKAAHERLRQEVKAELQKVGDEGKDPAIMAKGMALVKTKMKLLGQNKDGAAASLISDGCHMGVKSLARYLNQYKDADESTKDIARDLIALEETLGAQMRPYL